MKVFKNKRFQELDQEVLAGMQNNEVVITKNHEESPIGPFLVHQNESEGGHLAFPYKGAFNSLKLAVLFANALEGIGAIERIEAKLDSLRPEKLISAYATIGKSKKAVELTFKLSDYETIEDGQLFRKGDERRIYVDAETQRQIIFQVNHL